MVENPHLLLTTAPVTGWDWNNIAWGVRTLFGHSRMGQMIPVACSLGVSDAVCNMLGLQESFQEHFSWCLAQGNACVYVLKSVGLCWRARPCVCMPTGGRGAHA
jgi:hypothetical protein